MAMAIVNYIFAGKTSATLLDIQGPEKARARAELIVAALRGAMLLAKNPDGIALFDRIVADSIQC